VRLKEAHWSEARDHVMPLRVAVFVKEQGIPLELEADDDDPVSLHVWLEDETGAAFATGRLLPDGHIGRLAVAKARRGQGFGALVLAHLIESAWTRGFSQVVLHAQISALGFYESFGFVKEGDVFLEVDIPHQLMRLKPA